MSIISPCSPSPDDWNNIHGSQHAKLPAPQETSQNVKTEITFRRITDLRDPGVQSFIQTYQEAFSGPPYFENYSEQSVYEHVWEPHIDHCVVVAERDGEVIGLGCVHPLMGNDISKSAQEYLLSRNDLPLDPAKTIYMSELAVSEKARGQGLGSKLVIACYQWALKQGYTDYVLRTAAEGSNSLSLYSKMGGKLLAGEHAVSTVEGGTEATSSTSRVYLFGKLSDYHVHLENVRQVEPFKCAGVFDA